MKRLRLSKDEILPLALGHGGCLATDRIVVDGCPVGYMARDIPVRPQDSGWRFFAGDEDEVYMAEISHHGVYEVNTIANYDLTIIPYLDSPFGCRFERFNESEFAMLIEEEDDEEGDEGPFEGDDESYS